MSNFDKQLHRLLKRHGYEFLTFVDGSGKLTQKGIKGFSSDNELPWKFKSVFQAVEHLLSVCGESYRNDYEAIMEVHEEMNGVNR